MSYSPKLGRFIQTDPIQYEDGLSLYQSYRSSPADLVDPMGTAAEPTTKPTTQPTTLPTTQPTTKPHNPASCPTCARDPNAGDATDASANCDKYAFGLGRELIPDVVSEAITAGIIQGFGKDLDDDLGGSWLDKNSKKLELSLDNYFKKFPKRGHKLTNCNSPCPCGYRKVAAQNYDPSVLQGRDYHFVRQNPDGSWSDKLKGSNAGNAPGPSNKRDSSPQGCYCVNIPD